MLGTSAIILANNVSIEASKDKGTIFLDNKPLIRHVFDAVNSIVDEVIIVTNTQERADKYASLLPKTVKFAIDIQQTQNPLTGALTGFETAQGQYALLLPYNVPFINKELSKFLLELSIGKTAVVPRAPDNEIEPLCSVYQIKIVLETVKQVVSKEAISDLFVLVEKLWGVRYISMSVIKQIDPDLHSFFNINTQLDLKRAAVIFQGKQSQQQNRYRR